MFIISVVNIYILVNDIISLVMTTNMAGEVEQQILRYKKYLEKHTDRTDVEEKVSLFENINFCLTNNVCLSAFDIGLMCLLAVYMWLLTVCHSTWHCTDTSL